jgi:hypothetical protein
MRSNQLQLNGDKTEMLWVASVRQQHQLPTVPLAVGDQLVHPVRSVRNLGVFIDADLDMRSHAPTWSAWEHLFWRVASAAADSSVRAPVDVPDARRRAGSDTTTLRQQCSGWSPSTPSSTSSVGAQCGDAAHLRSSAVRPHP